MEVEMWVRRAENGKRKVWKGINRLKRPRKSRRKKERELSFLPSIGEKRKSSLFEQFGRFR